VAECQTLEPDKPHWFWKRKAQTKTQENAYAMTMASRKPRQIVGFDVPLDKAAMRRQGIIDTRTGQTALTFEAKSSNQNTGKRLCDDDGKSRTATNPWF
jgi:hypothetical protein